MVDYPCKHAHHKDSRVRFSEDTLCFEMLCMVCGEYWPLTLEFWEPPRGLWRCKACVREACKVRQKRYNKQPGVKEYQQMHRRQWYAATRDVRRAKRRDYEARKKLEQTQEAA